MFSEYYENPVPLYNVFKKKKKKIFNIQIAYR